MFFDSPLLGLGLGAAGGAIVSGVAGLAAAGAVSNKINKLANVANAKIGLLNLKTNLVKTGLVGASLLGGNLGETYITNNYYFISRLWGTRRSHHSQTSN